MNEDRRRNNSSDSRSSGYAGNGSFDWDDLFPEEEPKHRLARPVGQKAPSGRTPSAPRNTAPGIYDSAAQPRQDAVVPQRAASAPVRRSAAPRASASVQRPSAPVTHGTQPPQRRPSSAVSAEYSSSPHPRSSSPGAIKTGRKTPLILLVLGDILMGGVILCVFALFHHVIPMMTAEPVSAIPIAVSTPAPTPSPVPTPAPSAAPADAFVEPTPEPTPDPRTEWQIRFADQFTDEVVRTENSYTSPNIAVHVNKVVSGEGNSQVTYFVADIYVASMECFKTYIANNEYKYLATESIEDMSSDVNAILSIGGDFITYQGKGFLMRNGNLYMRDYTNCDLCVLYADGTLATYPKNGYSIEQVLERGAVQIWNFGPELLDAEGHAKSAFNTNSTVAQINPRTALGYYEPGHYCFIVVDGRQNGYSCGMLMDTLAQTMESLGCTVAYNLDGGGSTAMMFDGRIVNQRSNTSNNKGRALGDILYIAEPLPPAVPAEEVPASADAAAAAPVVPEGGLNG